MNMINTTLSKSSIVTMDEGDIHTSNHKFDRWKQERDINLEEDFVSALAKYAKEYKKKRIEKYEGHLCPFGC